VEAPKAAWEVDLGAVVFARPTLGTDDQGRSIAYVGTHAGRFSGVVTDGDDAGTVVTDLTVGGMIWSTAVQDARGRLYVGADDDTLYAIEPEKSKIVWTKKLGNCTPARAPGPEGARCDVDGGPTLGPDGDLYVGADGVYRVTTAGAVVWHWTGDKDRPKHVFSSPLVTKDGLVVFGGQDGFVTALHTDGTEAWRYKVGADVDGSAAAGIDGSIYIGADDGRMFALRSDGSLKWSFVSQSDIRSSVAVSTGGDIYLSSFDGNLYSLDPAGNVHWMLPSGGRIAASPVLDADGVVYVGSQDDRLYAVTPEGKVRWNVEFPTDIDSSVAITEAGTIVVGSDDGKLRGLR
jgi:outer membrane protein assembly factor BamB